MQKESYMCFKKKKDKENKIKPRGASNFSASFSIFAGVLALLTLVALFVFYFLWGDSFTTAIGKMEQGLIVLLLPLLAIAFVFWIILKLLMGGVTLSYMIISIVLLFVAGGIMKSASANHGNIYSNKRNRSRAITSMILWWVVIGFQCFGIFLTNTLTSPLSHNSQTFKMFSYICIGVFITFCFVCFLVTIIDFVKKSKDVKYNEKGQMIDETYATFTTVVGEKQNNSLPKIEDIACEYCGQSLSPGVQFCPNCGNKNIKRQLKVGDITKQGKVVGFDLTTNEPKFMPLNNNENK